MPLRPPAGFIRPGFDPLKNPDAPTAVAATGGAVDSGQVSVAFTPPANVGGSAVTEYYAVSNPDQITSVGAASPVTVTGLTSGTSYTFQVWALNSYGPGPWSAASNSASPTASMAVFIGGYSGNNVMDYVNIATTGNATDFGDATYMRDGGGAGNSTRGVFSTGRTSTPMIQYITYASAGDATDFGDFTVSNPNEPRIACSNSTRAVFGLSEQTNTMQYITIATTGTAVSFGQLLVPANRGCACASPTRGVIFAGEDTFDTFNTLNYITIATTGNAVDFGDLTTRTQVAASCSSSTRGLFAGGNFSGFLNTIQYITIASTGNSIDFGDLTVARQFFAGASSSTRGLFGGGQAGTPGAPFNSNVIDYVTIANTGNATDFGDLTVARYDLAACSNAHGGL
jgi:hypothetical protein